MEIEHYKYKNKEYKNNYYLTISIPVTYNAKTTYELYEDEFGNYYYENNWDFNSLEDAKNQNKKIQETLKYLISNGWVVDEEGLN